MYPHQHRIRFRHVHLDFHTAGDIPSVGSAFVAAEFQETLRAARVNSVTLFAKCHHGYSYHPTAVGQMHPGLQRNLLAEQIEACREIDVRCPIYLSAGFDELVASLHPDWLVEGRDGVTFDPTQTRCFHPLRWNSPYLDYLCRQIEEVNALWPDNDGIFLDIIGPRSDYSDQSLRERRAMGLDPFSPDAVRTHARANLADYFERSTAAALAGNPQRPVFHNANIFATGHDGALKWNSHLELESLPTGGWGWDHFPLTARYAQSLGFDFLGMTGKFHTTWGEFGGFKRPAALLYECGQMLGLGAKCSIGDQLHPSGRMNPDTYALIGQVYEDVQRKEPWCVDGKPLCDIGIVVAAPSEPPAPHDAGEGASRMLLELHQSYLVLDADRGWDGLQVIILPENLRLTPRLRDRAVAFLARGGRIISAGASLLNEEQTGFLLPLRARLQGRSPFAVDYLLPGDALPGVPVQSPTVIHGGAWDILPDEGCTVLAHRAEPYANRSPERFCGHQHDADAGPSPFPGAVQDGGVVWFAHDLFSRYRAYGQPLYRDYFASALRRVFGGALPIEAALPTGGRTALFEQPTHHRVLFHLWFGTPAVRGGKPLEGFSHFELPQLEIIEELIPLHDVDCALRLDRNVAAVSLVPEGIPLPFEQGSGTVRFKVPKLLGHQIVELRVTP